MNFLSDLDKKIAGAVVEQTNPECKVISYDVNGDGDCLFYAIDVALSQILKQYPGAVLDPDTNRLLAKLEATKNWIEENASAKDKDDDNAVEDGDQDDDNAVEDGDQDDDNAVEDGDQDDCC